MAKPELKAQAIEMRLERRASFNEIAGTLGVSKGTLSLWLKDYPLTPDELKRRQTRVHISEQLAPVREKAHATHPSLKSWQKGHIARLKVEARAAELGAYVSIPTTDTRYDLVIDSENFLYRVQVKYADVSMRNSRGSVLLSLLKNGKTYSASEIDALLVYVAKVDRVCWFGPEVFHGRQSITLRYKPAAIHRVDMRLVHEYFW